MELAKCLISRHTVYHYRNNTTKTALNVTFSNNFAVYVTKSFICYILPYFAAADFHRSYAANRFARIVPDIL